MPRMHRHLTSQASARGVKHYEDALNLLNSRRRDVRPNSIAEEVEGSEVMPKRPSFRGKPSLLGMRTWLNCIGHSDSDIDNLNVIHVAGTKGKGSTCAFTSSFLDAHRKRDGYPTKIGLYTSPHLKRVQERIQINCNPISEDIFTKYVFEVWDSLTSQALPKPRYLQLLMLVAVHTFIRENVDVAIYETHNGGEYDATNVFPRPIVTGISTIGMDHVEQLGPSIGNIAWHKAGIFKSKRPAFSTLQEPLVTTILERRASEKDVILKYVNIDPSLPANASVLGPDVQRLNASLALALTRSFLREKAPAASRDLTAQDIRMGIEQFFWVGRFQQITQGRHQWFLDGAHNELSVRNAAQWFSEMITQKQRSPTVSGCKRTFQADITSVTGPIPNIIIFSHISERDGAALLRCIATALQERHTLIQYLIVSTYDQSLDSINDADRCFRPPDQAFSTDMRTRYIDAWRSISPQTQTVFESTIEGALGFARSLDQGSGTKSLVTGSLYLVGGVLRILEPYS